MAGNTTFIQEINNVHVGYFWLWVIVLAALVPMLVIVVVFVSKIKKRRELEA